MLLNADSELSWLRKLRITWYFSSKGKDAGAFIKIESAYVTIVVNLFFILIPYYLKAGIINIKTPHMSLTSEPIGSDLPVQLRFMSQGWFATAHLTLYSEPQFPYSFKDAGNLYNEVSQHLD